MIITKCDRCRKVMDTPAYAAGMFPLMFPNANKNQYIQYIPKYMIIRSEPNDGQDNINLCPECEKDLDAFLDNPPGVRELKHDPMLWEET